jgi:hypothetical protein
VVEHPPEGGAVAIGPFVMAWFIGEGIICYRSVKNTKAPPMPGALLATSGLFTLLALIAESDKARPLAVVLAYGFDLAAFMNLYPPVTGGGTSSGQPETTSTQGAT